MLILLWYQLPAAISGPHAAAALSFQLRVGKQAKPILPLKGLVRVLRGGG